MVPIFRLDEFLSPGTMPRIDLLHFYFFSPLRLFLGISGASRLE